MQRPPPPPALDERNGRGAGGGRAADRRREQGRAPEPAGPKDTRTSLREPERAERAPPPPEALSKRDKKRDDGAFASLACVKGPEQGVTLALKPGSYTIGRARENELVLKDIAASRRHVRIDVDNGRAYLFDLGSGNGTKVNGKRISEHILAHGDTVEVGSCLLVFSELGKAAPPPDLGRDEAQARVVAAADELAKELSEKMRFGEEGFEDGFVAKTRALKTADARAIAEEIAREAAQKSSASAAQPNTRKLNDRLWNETFTNMPLSQVVATDQALQGGGAQRGDPRDRNDARAEPAAPTDQFRPPRRGPAPAGMPPPPTTHSDPPARFDGVDGESQFSRGVEASEMGGTRSSLVTVLVSALTVIVIGVLAIGAYVFFIKDGGSGVVDKGAAAVSAERDAEYATAIGRAQDAYAREDWAAVREYTTAALQVKANDPMAKQYQRDAERRLADAAAKAAPPTPPAAEQKPEPSAEAKPADTKPADAKPADPPVEKPAEVKPAEAKPVEKPVEKPAPAAEKPKPKPAPSKPKPAGKKGMSEKDAQAQFNAAIDAFRSKDNDTACQLLDKVADRAPADSVWKGKAESLFLKKCGG